MTGVERSDVIEGRAVFEGNETWYQVFGDLERARSGNGPAPLVTLHGGPGATHDYLLTMTDLTAGGRVVIFYDQLGIGHSPTFATEGRTSGPSTCSSGSSQT